MSVLIKGVTKPTDCILCPMFRGAWQMCALLNRDVHPKGTPKNCPMVELPPHGRLIDADAFEADRRKHYCENCEMRKGKKNGRWTFVYEIGGAACLPCGIEDALDDLEDATTVIGAEAEI